MAKIYFLANAFSPHVRQWVEFNENLGNEIIIFTIEKHGPMTINTRTVYVGSKYITKFKIFKYIYAGLCLRFNKNLRDTLIQAHNASGYGLVALISGHEYLLTTYGSEIFSVEKRGRIYKWILKKVLHNAKKISTTSMEMKDFLCSTLDVSSSKIQNFSLGVNTIFLTEQLSSINSTFRVFSNRRITPLYQIEKIIDAFQRFIVKFPESKAELILLEGDSDPEYLSIIKKILMKLNLFDQIKIIDGFVSERLILELLSKSSCTISIPITDQLSSSILESLAVGVCPIISDLGAYRYLKESSLVEIAGDDLLVPMEKVYLEYISGALNFRRIERINYIKKLNSRVADNLVKFYN